MKFIKKLFIGIISLIAIILIIALFLKKEYTSQSSVTINKPIEEVFDYVKLLKNQDEYSKWQKLDQHTKHTYIGTDGTVGFVSQWESKNEHVGKGEQEIIAITENERIDFALRFFEPMEAEEPAYMTTKALSETSTEVTWGFNGHMKWPLNIMIYAMGIEKMITKDLEEGLINLKNILESTEYTVIAQDSVAVVDTIK